jgi:hypothetical protein
MLRKAMSLVCTTVCLAIVFPLVTVVQPAGATTHRDATGPTVRITSHTKYSLSKGFVGLTFEATTAGEPYLDPSQSNLPSFLADLGQGNLRFGGQSSDLNVAWQPDPTQPLPAWASNGVTPGDLTTIANLAHATGWSVDLGVNLLHYDPAAAADEVGVARSVLGSSLHDVEIGNEPDLYFYFEAFLTIPVVGIPTTYPAYLTNWDAYKAAISAANPGVTFAGDDFYLTDWIPDLTKQSEKGLSEYTQHFYPQADCGGGVVSPEQLLSDGSFGTESAEIATAETGAKQRNLPLVLDEFNSISCGSSSPAAYEFASSLWAVRALLQAAAHGVSSVNMQMDPDNCNSYSPLCVPDPSSPATMQATPIFSGMQLVSSLEGGKFLHTSVSPTNPLPDGVSDYAVRLPDGDSAVVVDNSTDVPVSDLSLELGRNAQLISTQLLTAPSIEATDGVTMTTSPPTSSTPTGLTVPAGSVEVFTLAP